IEILLANLPSGPLRVGRPRGMRVTWNRACARGSRPYAMYARWSHHEHTASERSVPDRRRAEARDAQGHRAVEEQRLRVVPRPEEDDVPARRLRGGAALAGDAARGAG